MKERLDRSIWIDEGLARLGDAGPAALQIPVIAKRLGVTKGSFYWHFRDLAEYEDALLAAWEQQYTKDFLSSVEAFTGPPPQRLLHLLDRAFETDTKVARAVRHWSAIDARAGRMQARVDRKRVAYLARLLRDLGWTRTEASTLARWCYWSIIGFHVTRTPKMTSRETNVLLRALVPPSPDQSRIVRS